VRTRTAHVGTTRPDGRPRVKPVWFVLDEQPGHFQLCLHHLCRFGLRAAACAGMARSRCRSTIPPRRTPWSSWRHGTGQRRPRLGPPGRHQDRRPLHWGPAGPRSSGPASACRGTPGPGDPGPGDRPQCSRAASRGKSLTLTCSVTSWDRFVLRPEFDFPVCRWKAPSGLAEASFLRVPAVRSPRLLESNPWRRLTISEHRRAPPS
jgi:hypothetical protein